MIEDCCHRWRCGVFFLPAVQKMMDLCKRDLCDPAWASSPAMPAAVTVRIDADAEEEYLASSYGSAVTHMADTGNSFWSNRSEKNKTAQKDLDKKAQEKKELMAFLQERVDARKQLADELVNNRSHYAAKAAGAYSAAVPSFGAASGFGGGTFW